MPLSIRNSLPQAILNADMDYDALLDKVLDGGYLPHAVIRQGIRAQLRQRISLIASTNLSDAYATKMKYVERLKTQPIAIETASANEQHYEVATGVFTSHLGPRMKYSSCLYPKGSESMAQAEIAMLDCYVERAGVEDGMKIFDLGCGWGSLSLYLAERFPKSKVTAFSNSRTQKNYIDSQAQSKNLTNLTVVTGDIATYEFANTDLAGTFDRVMSVEMFEHMKNYHLLMRKVSDLLRPGGKLFVHLFAHKDSPYDFEGGWMTTHFFTGGTMPSADLLLFFQDDLRIQNQWWVSGTHYAKTLEEWLERFVAARKAVWPYLEESYGGEAWRWWNRWQVFYLACAELFAWNGGETWGVVHYLFEKPAK